MSAASLNPNTVWTAQINSRTLSRHWLETMCQFNSRAPIPFPWSKFSTCQPHAWRWAIASSFLSTPTSRSMAATTWRAARLSTMESRPWSPSASLNSLLHRASCVGSQNCLLVSLRFLVKMATSRSKEVSRPRLPWIESEENSDCSWIEKRQKWWQGHMLTAKLSRSSTALRKWFGLRIWHQRKLLLILQIKRSMPLNLSLQISLLNWTRIKKQLSVRSRCLAPASRRCHNFQRLTLTARQTRWSYSWSQERWRIMIIWNNHHLF